MPTSDPPPIRCGQCGTRHGALRMFAGFGVRCWQCCAGSALISWRHGVNARVEVRDVRTEENPDGLLRAEEVARMGWEPYDEAEDVPCPQWVGPYDTLVDGQSLVALSPLDPPEDT